MKLLRPVHAAVVALAALPWAVYAGGFTLSSPVVHPGGWLGEAQVLKGFGCEGGNTSPALSWHGAPKGTKSYAVTVYDPDAPTGSGWWHWVVYNIPADVTTLAENAGIPDGKGLPTGAVQGRTDFGAPGYGGACPPKGDKPHRYVFTVHALKTEKLELPSDASAAMVGYMIHANAIGSATLRGKYQR